MKETGKGKKRKEEDTCRERGRGRVVGQPHLSSLDPVMPKSCLFMDFQAV